MKDKIIKILNDRTEDNEMTHGDVVSYIPDWEFEEVAQELVKLFAIPVMLNAKNIADFEAYAKKYYHPPTLKRMYKDKDRSIIITEEHLIKQFKKAYNISI